MRLNWVGQLAFHTECTWIKYFGPKEVPPAMVRIHTKALSLACFSFVHSGTMLIVHQHSLLNPHHGFSVGLVCFRINWSLEKDTQLKIGRGILAIQGPYCMLDMLRPLWCGLLYFFLELIIFHCVNPKYEYFSFREKLMKVDWISLSKLLSSTEVSLKIQNP